MCKPLKYTLIVCAGILLASSCDLESKSRRALDAIIKTEAEAAARETSDAAADAPKSSRGDVPKVSYLPQNPASSKSQIVNYEGFTVSFNPSNHTPDWSCWELLDTETDGAYSRKGQKFEQDTRVAGCPTTKDYVKSGYDRGHLCPAADMKWSAAAMDDCFYMTNIAPQDHALNSGAWSTLEKKCRKWAQEYGSLVIVAGPLYESSDTRRIGATGVRVPSAFFKVIAAPAQKQGIAFVYPNMTSPGNMNNYAVSISDVEKLTGIDFFAQYPAELQKEIETGYDLKLWR